MRSTIVLVGALLGLAANGGAREKPAAPPAVLVDYRVTEASAEAVERDVLVPIERAVRSLGRLEAVRGMATHGRAVLEVRFEGGASRTDLAAVTERIDAVRFAPSVEVTERNIALGPPSDP